MAKKLLIGTAWTLAVLVLVSGALCFWAWHELNRYASTPAAVDAGVVTYVVRSGQGVSEISSSLGAGGIIRRPLAFRIFSRLNGFDTQIKAGEYRLSAAMSPADILEKLVKGEVVLYRLTIPEGYTMLQIADLVGDSGITGRGGFLETLSDRELMGRLDIEAESFEGYLFPDTYFFPKDTAAETIISTLVSRFQSVMTSRRLERAQELGLSVHGVVTLAAIIEKETGAAEERPVISSVFHNRLKRGMRLESDPTVIYGIEGFDGNITRKHLAEQTPYNTYRIKGLPAGPIANPGEASIEAALFPANTDYLYFVAKKDGTHQFSTNITDHNRAVAKYQLNR
jgi:UPF0755 protein